MTYGCMLHVCAGDDKTGPNQCSSLITARLHGLIQHQNESTYFKSSTADKPRRFSGGAPLLPGWQEGAGQVPRPTVMVRRLHLDLREAIPKTIPKSQAEESKSEVKSIYTSHAQPPANWPSVAKRVMLFGQMYPYNKEKSREIFCCIVNKINLIWVGPLLK